MTCQPALYICFQLEAYLPCEVKDSADDTITISFWLTAPNMWEQIICKHPDTLGSFSNEGIFGNVRS